MRGILVAALPGLLVAGLALAPAHVLADTPLDCQLRYDLSGWSAFYKTASGTGTVSCSNGQSMNVKIRAKGGGISFGKTRIVDGRGEFSGVRGLDEVLGAYVTAEAHAGATRSAGAQVMTKGEVSLALAGKGEGWSLGVAFGKFVIER
ncbi:hypothetical protein LY625_05205 [Lysobacter sp. GX 14042]|uniref:hypothetical protein n=1 Tax=Lysobacter sp. GX 14042 TaxID=2907155 RepID=UPI001F37C9E5|nr:hypothetical protein [Lysobacter sp. GX 14042]MCE7032019.1 hypothetical protein [Lysobacter sp. GX 14042]